jgi:large subunit ribosomal protein L25
MVTRPHAWLRRLHFVDGGFFMAEIRLKAELRAEPGKGRARRARAEGKVPAIVYGRGMDPVAISVDRREFVTALKTDAGMNMLLNIEYDGQSTLALTRELQRDPVRGTLLHADFVKVDRTQEVEVEVPVHLIGDSAGVKEGGVLEHPLFQLHVRSLATEVPQSVEVDISALNIGDALRVSDIAADAKFQILDDPDSIVASVAAPISEAELEAMEQEAAPTVEAPEEGAEPEAAPEGEAGAEAPEAAADGSADDS